MKAEVYRFKHPITVVQAFHHHYTYQKDQRRLDDRRDKAAWQQTYASTSGYVEDGVLYLPPETAGTARLAQNTHLFLNDYQDDKYWYWLKGEKNPFEVLNLKNSFPGYDAFKFKGLVGGAFEIYLYWSFFEFFGEAEQHKIAELHPGKTLEIRRNRVTNFSATGRRAKVYLEAFTMLQMLGTFTEAVVLREPVEPHIKQLPQPNKVVDVMKHLY